MISAIPIRAPYNGKIVLILPVDWRMFNEAHRRGTTTSHEPSSVGSAK